ncbi:hypothetical protein [Gryllotalpicola protaetiae]|uniref:Uncharacterized protein n=1 Tax=Gryllotalpicola protaetiae TaxID=2419771 RepID=A0A387BQV2_9MICO|nr:hypothetical protein [Gryllotalpicola protaetiae]AYG03356.1 hypothetical protein D7I44_07305 [Gryllotalpicola protaetiae]
MTDFPSRRSLREASGARAARKHAADRGPHSRRRVAAAGAATLLLVGSAMVAIPADAATVSSHTLYASELLANSQSLTVRSDVKGDAVENTSFDSSTFTSPGGSPALTVGGVTNADWAALVLQDAGLPVTQNNVTVILQWMDSENSPKTWYLRNNPLNNGLGSGGGGGFGSYANLRIAASYVAQQLDRSLFAGIHAALAADSAPGVTEQAIVASPWASSHYGGGARFHAVNVPIVAAPASAWG